MKWGITGAGGMLALDLQEVLSSADEQFFAWKREELDIANLENLEKLLTQSKPDTVINCAAFTKVDEAEIRQTEAFAINSIGAANLAKVCVKLDIKLIHVSTDFVFDGSKTSPYTVNDEVNPINLYGRSKQHGEVAVLQSSDRNLVVRTSWLYGKHGTNFVKTMLQLAKTKKDLKIVSDQQGCPTWTVDLSHALMKLGKCNASGIFHYSNIGICSWYEFASETFQKAYQIGLIKEVSKVNPIASVEYSTLAQRPTFSVLDTSRYSEICHEAPPHWKDSLAQALPYFSTPSS